MSKMNKISLLLLVVVITGCKTANIPEAYDYKVKELQKNPFGCWMDISVNTADSVPEIHSMAGELLYMDSDSSFLLVADGVVNRFGNRSIVSAKLYTHKNQSGTYMLTTGLLILPNIIGAIAYPEDAGGFLLLGVPVAITGITQAAIESSGKKHIMAFPERNKLNEFCKFSRFPGGIPENIDLRLLYLKKM